MNYRDKKNKTLFVETLLIFNFYEDKKGMFLH